MTNDLGLQPFRRVIEMLTIPSKNRGNPGAAAFRRRGFARSAYLFVLAIAAGLVGTAWRPGGDPSAPAGAGTLTNTSLPPSVTTRPIESLEVGQRVIARNPQLADADRRSRPEPDWRDWLRLSLRMPLPVADAGQPAGDLPLLEIELLRPEGWLREHARLLVEPSPVVERLETPIDSARGRSTSGGLPLSPLRPIFRDLAIALVDGATGGLDLSAIVVSIDLPEMGVAGPAVLVDLQPCPPIAAGRGRVITGTFAHPPAHRVLDVWFDGESEPIGVTENHLFWSVAGQRFVPIGEMEAGQRVRTYHGETKRIIRKLPRPGPQTVHNLEVDREHVYYVGRQGILVHNAYQTNTRAGRLAELREKYGDPFRKALASPISDRDAAFATVKAVRSYVQKKMRSDPAMQQLLADGDFMTYGFVFDARAKKLLGVSGGRTPVLPGLSGTQAVVRPGGKFGVRGDYRMPDLRYDGPAGTEYWDIKPASFVWNQQFQDILDWTGIQPLPIGYNR